MIVAVCERGCVAGSGRSRVTSSNAHLAVVVGFDRPQIRVSTTSSPPLREFSIPAIASSSNCSGWSTPVGRHSVGMARPMS